MKYGALYIFYDGMLEPLGQRARLQARAHIAVRCRTAEETLPSKVLPESALIRINSKGFRDLERETTNPADVFRIAVLGDSFAKAFQVPVDNTFWAVLEREINNSRCNALGGKTAEVLNLGVSGYGTAQELVVILAPPFVGYARTNCVCLHGFDATNPCTGRWNEMGHQLASRVIARHICSGTHR